MTTHKNFAKTHNRKPKEIIDLLRENIDKINADEEHAKCVDGDWLFDDFAVDFLERELEEQKKIAVISKPEFLKENNLPQDENSLLKKQIAELQESLQLAKDSANAKDEEFKKLQSRILSYEDGASSINGDLIRKYQTKSERLEKELAQSQADMNKLRDLKDNHISKQENTIRELQNKISELNDIIKKKMESDMENLQKSISEDKLKSEIHDLELKLADSQRDKEKVRIALEDSEMKNAELAKLISASIKSLSKVQQNLRGGIEVQISENIVEENPATFTQQTQPEVTEPAPKVGFFKRVMKAAGFF